MDEPRRYGQWAGRPNGNAEDKSCCIEEVWSNFVGYQCTRKRGHGPGGLYCKQHAKKHQHARDAGEE